MKIDIELSKMDCLKLLEQNGYDIIENVLGYWYDDERFDRKTISGSCYIECAFQSNNKPSFLEKAQPTVDEVREHSIENVVSRIFNQKLFKLINNN